MFLSTSVCVYLVLEDISSIEMRGQILFVELSKCVFHQVHSKQAVAVVFGKHCTLFNVMTSDNLSEILTIKPGFNF